MFIYSPYFTGRNANYHDARVFLLVAIMPSLYKLLMLLFSLSAFPFHCWSHAGTLLSNVPSNIETRMALTSWINACKLWMDSRVPASSSFATTRCRRYALVNVWHV